MALVIRWLFKKKFNNLFLFEGLGEYINSNPGHIGPSS